jgi:hypothetical protein
MDTRLRDALRGGGPPLHSAEGSDNRFALDDATLRDADLVRVVRRLDDVRARVDAVEGRLR